MQVNDINQLIALREQQLTDAREIKSRLEQLFGAAATEMPGQQTINNNHVPRKTYKTKRKRFKFRKGVGKAAFRAMAELLGRANTAKVTTIVRRDWPHRPKPTNVQVSRALTSLRRTGKLRAEHTPHTRECIWILN